MASIIGTAEAAERKGCSRNSILGAIRKGSIDGEKLGPRSYVVRDNKKFQEWQPNAARQQIGRESQKPKRQAKRK